MTTREQIKQLVESGKKAAEIAPIVGLSRGRIKEYMLDADIYETDEPGYGHCNHLSKAWLRQSIRVEV